MGFVIITWTTASELTLYDGFNGRHYLLYRAGAFSHSEKGVLAFVFNTLIREKWEPYNISLPTNHKELNTWVWRSDATTAPEAIISSALKQ
jgi:hypothetical protein